METLESLHPELRPVSSEWGTGDFVGAELRLDGLCFGPAATFL